MPALEIKAPAFHEGQQLVRNSKARYRVAPCGRRWGKTLYYGWEIVETPLLGRGDSWWVWPTHKQGRPGWKHMRRLGSQLQTRIPGIKINATDKAVIFPNGYEAILKSADDPDSLRGDGPALVVFDEASLMPERVWTEIIRPSLADKSGRASFIFTPKGRDWTFNLYSRGLDPEEPDWESWNFSTLDNPFLPQEERDQLLRDYEAGRIPERVWRQEIMAEFLADEGQVFRRIHQNATATETGPVTGSYYVIGVDVAKQSDFTVASVWDVAKKQQVQIDRFNQIDYVFQESRIAALAERYNGATLVVETNSTGEALCERFERRGLRVVRFTTTQGSKADAVEAFAVALENGEATLLEESAENGAVQIHELMAYERIRRANNKYSYSHPDGGHDDTVDAAWLAWTELDEGQQVGFLAV